VQVIEDTKILELNLTLAQCTLQHDQRARSLGAVQRHSLQHVVHGEAMRHQLMRLRFVKLSGKATGGPGFE